MWYEACDFLKDVAASPRDELAVCGCRQKTVFKTFDTSQVSRTLTRTATAMECKFTTRFSRRLGSKATVKSKFK